MHHDTLRYRGRAALFGAAITIALSCGASALANPSQVQYGYDPIVDAGGSASGGSGAQSGDSGEATNPDARVDRAASIVEGILRARARDPQDSGAQGGRTESQGLGARNRPGEAALIETSREGGGGLPVLGSTWLIVVLLTLALGLIGWAAIRRRDLRGADLAIRSISAAVFIGLILVLNGSLGSVLG